MKELRITDSFEKRHIGTLNDNTEAMLQLIGVKSLDELIEKTIPKNIMKFEVSKEDGGVSEYEYMDEISKTAKLNKLFRSFIGLGYYGTITPSVIKRNILQNPGWYTQYTPYQAEISQGRLEALLNFQTVISDLTGLPIANASLLDEATAAAESMIMLYNSRKANKKNSDTFLVANDLFPQTIDVLATRALPLGIKLKVAKVEDFELTDDLYGILVQYPNYYGKINNYSDLFKLASSKGIFCAVAADIMSLCLLTPPGEFGADVVLGNTQRFGIPIGFGGPHAAYFSVKDEFKRAIPGRIIGISIDSKGNRALRMALQTREQHIKREKATSNICTAQALLAIMAGMYAVYHGSAGLKNIAQRINNSAKYLTKGLEQLGYNLTNKYYFDTLKIEVEDVELIEKIKKEALKNEINFWFEENSILISVDETTLQRDLNDILSVFANAKGEIIDPIIAKLSEGEIYLTSSFPEELNRKTQFLTHPVFNSYHSETELMRYIKNLEKRDLSLTSSMIPLGSCTMKLNAATEMFPIEFPEFANLHPFIPENQALGYKKMIDELNEILCKLTGFAAISFQPNSGAQGEYAGLMVIRSYHCSRGEGHRNIILIPSSAHGTNPASAVMAGGKVVVVACDEKGNIDIKDLELKAEQNKDNLAALMVTYPSTHGVFEEDIIEICNIIHNFGGQVYMDGANMNAQVALTSPGIIGADVCHLNLHKTFSIPHGGGGPGMGPIAVASHLVPFLPKHVFEAKKGISAVSAAPFGSASILPISHAYVKMMGEKGLQNATKYAILNANYIKARLESYYKVLYTGKNGFVAHELIFDMHEFKQTAGIEVEDIAKRLMDYSFHAPTVSFPVHGTLMVEPTESESKAELDRFCDAMIQIRKEIEEIEQGLYSKEDNVIKSAPHTILEVCSDNWTHSYTREKAGYPLPYTKENKFWPTVSKINNAYGDRNLICSCSPIESYK
ncbi:MAG TPA: aminomethyl-transferring glycine dehydrogenase [Melioribacteraceae bacterium]|nr:aminomethyl-transferring glycine dehydrogenase [Melioribacteraceae bacterium]